MRDDMTKQSIDIRFPGVTPDVANALAESLAKDIQASVKDDGKPVKPDIRRIDPQAQDFGTSLVLALGAPAAVILANAIRDWMRRKEVVIEVNKTTIRGHQDAAEIVKALNARK
jgi:hypothetical protein